MYLFDRRMTLDGKNAPAVREFVYRKPVMRPVSVFVPFYADTESNRAIRYAMACDGIPDNPMPTPPETTEHIDVLIRERDYDEMDGRLRCHMRQLWLLANQYTQAKRDRLVGGFTIKRLSGLNEDGYVRSEVQGMVYAALKGHPMPTAAMQSGPTSKGTHSA